MDSILSILKNCFIDISNVIRKGNSFDLESTFGKVNESGDHIKFLDKFTNDIFIDKLSKCVDVHSIASEEEEDFVISGKGEYVVVLDPLDGSTNIGINVTIGTIFGVFKLSENGKIRDGNDLVMAGYCLYGNSTQLIVATRESGISLHILNTDTNKFEYYQDIKIPDSGIYYSINEGYSLKWNNNKVRRFINLMKLQKKSLRFVGSMVVDVHRTIMKGGCFLYPDDCDNPNGKLRLVYECYPMSFIFKVGGGYSINEDGNDILHIPFPYDDLHVKTPILMFSKKEYKDYIE